MSKIKKLAVLCFMILLGSFVITNSVNAESKYFSYTDLCYNETLLCAQHHQGMHGSTYKLVTEINITGNKSTGNGATVESWHNAKLASILSHRRGQGNYGVNDVENLPVQNAIWNYLGTWRSEVGYKHGIKQDFVNNSKGNFNTSIETEAEEYANNYKNGNLTQITDKTDKSKIKVTQYTEGNEQYLRVGPFKYEFPEKLSEINVITDKNSKMEIKCFEKRINDNQYSKYSNINQIKSGNEFYISVKMPTDGTNQIKKITVKGKANVKHVTIKFWESTSMSQQNLLQYNYSNEEIDINQTFDYNIKILGNLKVIKVNKDNIKIKLQGVGFYVQNKDTKKWVKVENDTVSYTDKKEDATEFITDKNGEITIKNLVVGTYVAYETKNPNYGYEIIKEGQEKLITVDKTAELQIPNPQKYIKLSGYVWVDKVFSKQASRNDLYKDNDYDSNDILLDGITVRLIDKTTGKVVKEAKTADGGKYLFTDVLVDELENYYIEFEYDGLTYTNVIPHIDKDNGSKAAENSSVRDEFNKGFSVIEGSTESNKGITKDSAGNPKYDLNYNIDKNKHTSTLNNTGLYPITANTNETGYVIKDHFTPGQEEIKYINLGLYEREQPDIALIKDLYNVNVAINGYNHIYEYANRFNNQGEYGDGFNVGVKFGNKYGNMSYTRAIYKADKEYTSSDKSKELKVYVTYKISMKNESSNLQVQVNSIVDYYDSNYTLIKTGTGIDEKGNVTGDISNSGSQSYNDKYKKVIINTNSKIEHNKSADVYVQFELNRDAVLKILNNAENLDNVVEINSYSVFDTDGKVYAGIDKDSNPGNAVPGEKITYEDDTDSAPGLKLVVADKAREMTGKVFLDSTSNELKTGEVRQGDGIYTDGEKEIKDVKVTLKENKENGKVYETTTNDKGDFKIEGYIPGDYTLTYTWGDKEYTVQNYKGTVYEKDRYDANVTNKEWYKTDVNTRYTDAIDNYNTRKKIDAEIAKVTNKTATTIDKMDSTTPTMGISVQYTTTTTAEVADDIKEERGDKFNCPDFKIENIDFGIVERARQDLALRKRVNTFKVTLANGQVIADMTIDEKGNITGERNHVTYMGPSSSTGNGFVKLELDNELIQGATVEVEYEIKVTNNSELDYVSEDFYKYGIKSGNEVTITPTSIIDYLDKNWGFEAEKNKEWTVKSLDEIKNIVAKEVYENEDSTIADKTILYTDSLKGQKLKPTESATVNLNVSKVLSNSDEISLDNESEITELTKDGGSRLISTPGNYIPGQEETKESDESIAETVIVTPSTGANLEFIVPIMIGVIALVILGAGVVIIKKKTL
ncbi:MAG TPA: SpaA isopeptide-forming pilin-related protein [Clostridiaceae bacterium]|nr:SpaA isopeptide-forming pilin-related protein [Clostridiaceae bacterium]